MIALLWFLIEDVFRINNTVTFQLDSKNSMDVHAPRVFLQIQRSWKEAWFFTNVFWSSIFSKCIPFRCDYNGLPRIARITPVVHRVFSDNSKSTRVTAFRIHPQIVKVQRGYEEQTAQCVVPWETSLPFGVLHLEVKRLSIGNLNLTKLTRNPKIRVSLKVV